MAVFARTQRFKAQSKRSAEFFILLSQLIPPFPYPRNPAAE